MKLKDRIKEARKAKGLTQPQLAELCGVTRQAVYYWESGKREPSLEASVCLAKNLDLNIFDLIEDVYLLNSKELQEFFKKHEYSENEKDSLNNGLWLHSLLYGEAEEVALGPDETLKLIQFHKQLLATRNFSIESSTFRNIIVSPEGERRVISTLNLDRIRNTLLKEYFELLLEKSTSPPENCED